MQNFYYDIPTKVFFGEGQIQNLPELVSEFDNGPFWCTVAAV